MIILLWVVVIIAAVAFYLNELYSRFSKHGVKNPPGLSGNIINALLEKKHFIESMQKMYYFCPGERFIGIFQFLTPSVLIRDLDLLKKITTKDFEYFIDHRGLIDEDADKFFGRSLISLKGQEWKDMRSTLSPAFTSSKIKLMVPFMVDVGEKMIKSLKKKIDASENKYVDLEVKNLTSKYANDVIASCAFGVSVNSNEEEDNEFYKNGTSVTNFGPKVMAKSFLYSIFPFIAKSLNISIIAEGPKAFFRNLVLNTMSEREVHNIHRPDMIHLLMEAKKGKLSHDDKTTDVGNAGFATVEESSVGKRKVTRVWSDDDLVAQATLFLFAGFETVSTTMWFLLYELAVNPEAQERLAQEIKENELKNNGKFDYKSIQSMNYLDMVVSETLRLWAAGSATDRLCVKDYNLGKPNDTASEDFIIRKGELISIPILSFHRDPKYFPNPEKFDPERFSEENKHKIIPLSYMPFGLGPRNCIGSRFALCELKVMTYQLIKHIKLSPCPKTVIPIQLRADSFNLKVKGGHWLRLEVRE